MAWLVVWWLERLVGNGDTEVDGCADYCEGLCGVSWPSIMRLEVACRYAERTCRGVNHQRLPVDAIVDVVVLMSCVWWYYRGCCCCRKGEREEEGQRQGANVNITDDGTTTSCVCM